MAYMSQENKARLTPGIKAVLAKYKLKGTISVSRGGHSLSVNIKSGALDIIGNWYQHCTDPMRPGNPQDREYLLKCGIPKSLNVNTYHIDSQYTGKVRDALKELKAAMMVGNHDNSDIMTDYFDVGWYIDINVGKWNKPYVLTK
jgi:hypothetical protein